MTEITKYDILYETLKRIQVVRYQLKEACLDYKFTGISIHPDDYREIRCAEMAHFIFGTDFSSMLGMKVSVDHNTKKGKPELIMELPE